MRNLLAVILGCGSCIGLTATGVPFFACAIVAALLGIIVGLV